MAARGDAAHGHPHHYGTRLLEREVDLDLIALLQRLDETDEHDVITAGLHRQRAVERQIERPRRRHLHDPVHHFARVDCGRRGGGGGDGDQTVSPGSVVHQAHIGSARGSHGRGGGAGEGLSDHDAAGTHPAWRGKDGREGEQHGG